MGARAKKKGKGKAKVLKVAKLKVVAALYSAEEDKGD